MFSESTVIFLYIAQTDTANHYQMSAYIYTLLSHWILTEIYFRIIIVNIQMKSILAMLNLEKKKKK